MTTSGSVPTVYAKGHLKKYAALLGLPAAEILRRYESCAPAPNRRPHAGLELAAAVARRFAPQADACRCRKSAQSWLPRCCSGVLWWRPWHRTRRSRQRRQPRGRRAKRAGRRGSGRSDLPTPSNPACVSSATARAASSSATAAAAVAADPATAARAGAEAAIAPVPGAGHARLRLSFSADSWVDIHDATGKRTFAGNGLANSVKTVSGVAPLRVYLGWAAACSWKSTIAPSRSGRSFLPATWRASKPAPTASCGAIRIPNQRTVRRRATRVRPAERGTP